MHTYLTFHSHLSFFPTHCEAAHRRTLARVTAGMEDGKGDVTREIEAVVANGNQVAAHVTWTTRDLTKAEELCCL